MEYFDCFSGFEAKESVVSKVNAFILCRFCKGLHFPEKIVPWEEDDFLWFFEISQNRLQVLFDFFNLFAIFFGLLELRMQKLLAL